jgi:SAM-dependent methyltransferase
LRADRLRHVGDDIVSGRLVCASCNQAYPIIAGIPSLFLSPHPYPRYFLPPEDLLPEPRVSLSEKRNSTSGLALMLKYHGKAAFLEAIRTRRPSRRFDVGCFTDLRTRQKAYRFSRRSFSVRMVDRVIKKRWWTDERCIGMVNVLKKLRPRRLLDIASGGGGFLSKVMPGLRSTRAVGLEIYVPNCRLVTGLARYLGFDGRLQMVHGDARLMPFPSAAFDCVSGWTAAYHISQYERAMQESARVLRRGGHFVGTFHAEYPDHSDGLLTREEEEEFIRWARLPLNIRNVCRTLEKAGFAIVSNAVVGDSRLVVARRL